MREGEREGGRAQTLIVCILNLQHSEAAGTGH